MDEETSLILTVYEGRGFSLENGWNVLVVAKLEEVELATSPVPLTPQPKFEEEISWRISYSVFSKLRRLGVSVVVDCMVQGPQVNDKYSLGCVVLPLTSLDPKVKSEARWHSLGPHIAQRPTPSLLLGLNIGHEAGEGQEEFAVLKRNNQRSEVEDVNVVTSINKMLLMEESGKHKSDIITIDGSQGSTEWEFKKSNLESRSEHSSVISHNSSGVQEFYSHGNSVPISHQKGTSFPSQNHIGKPSLHYSTLKNKSVKENGHKVDPQISFSKSSEIVALPSTSREQPYAPDKLCAVPRLNAKGSYFQIGPTGEQGEQMFEYSITIVFAKFLDQLVPPNMEIHETNSTMFCYSLLTHFVYGEPIKDLAHPDFQAENTVGRICSTVHNLSEYFMQHADLPINLTVGDICLASANVKLSQFASSILTGGLPVKVEGSYPLVPNLFSPLGWKPKGEPVVGIIVNLATVGEELSVLPFPSMVRDMLNSDRGFHPVLGVSSASSTRTLSDSQEDSDIEWIDQKDGLSSRNHGTVAKLGQTSRHKRRHKMWAQKERTLQMAALEVEKWKESEQESYWKQWSAREAELQQHLAQEWESHMNSMENQLQQRLEQCHTLHKRLTEGLCSVETREKSVSLKEEAMKTQKEEIKLMKSELKHLLKEAAKVSKKERERIEEGEVANLQKQLIHEKRQRKLFQRQVRELEAAKRTAESTIDALRLGSQIKDEDISVLKRDKEQLQEELSVCRQRKEYYKMQWIKAVGQVHQARSDMNSYRVGIEKVSPKHRMQPHPNNAIQYKDASPNERRKLRSFPEHVIPQEQEKKGRITETFTDSKKFVKDLMKERKGLRDIVTKRRRVEIDDEEVNDIKVLSSPSDVRKVMHSLVDR